mgnify:CR=1 FL=1
MLTISTSLSDFFAQATVLLTNAQAHAATLNNSKEQEKGETQNATQQCDAAIKALSD